MEESVITLSQVANWLGASSLHLTPMEESFNQQHHYVAFIILSALLATLTLVKIARWLEISGIYSSYDESLWKGTKALFCALSALFRLSTLSHLFFNETNQERERRLLDECGGQTVLPPRRSNSTCRRIGSSRKRLKRFKDQWKQGSFQDEPPPWIREQRIAWEKNVCKFYMEVMVRDHDALEGELAERDNTLERLKEEIIELNLRVDQNRNWYCKIWNMYQPGDVVKKAPISMAKMALTQSDLWEAMYRQNISRLEREANIRDFQLENMEQQHTSLKRQITDLKNEGESYKQSAEQLSEVIADLRCELELSRKQAKSKVREEILSDSPRIEDKPDDGGEYERKIASAGRRAKHRLSKESFNTESKEMSTELTGADANEDETLLSWT